MTTGARIKEIRNKNGMLQSELASQVGCTAQVISNIERGVTHATAELAAKIATALHVPVDDLCKDGAPVSDHLTKEERSLIQNYRRLLPEEQRVLSAFIDTLLNRK